MHIFLVRSSRSAAVGCWLFAVSSLSLSLLLFVVATTTTAAAAEAATAVSSRMQAAA